MNYENVRYDALKIAGAQPHPDRGVESVLSDAQALVQWVKTGYRQEPDVHADR